MHRANLAREAARSNDRNRWKADVWPLASLRNSDVLNFEKVADPRQQELHAYADQEKAENSGHGIDAAGPEIADHRAGHSQHQEAENERQRHSQDDGDVNHAPVFRPDAPDLGCGTQDDGDGAGACQARHCQRGKGYVDMALQRLGCRRRQRPGLGKEHTKADGRNYQAAGNADSRDGNPEEIDDGPA